MTLCNNDCIQCCDFCAHSKHGTLDTDGNTRPIGCFLHLDKEHQEIAEDCGYCDDFYCFRVKDAGG